jgi:hypothetical protein
MSAQTVAETMQKSSAGPEETELQPVRNHGESHPAEGHTLNVKETALTRTNLLKVLATSLSFFFAGNNDGSLGALTPYILRTYKVGTGYVALM